MSEYDQHQAAKGTAQYRQMAGRRLPPNYRENAEHLREWLDGGLVPLAARVGWVLNGSYGEEYYLWLWQQLEDLPATPGRRAQAVKRIAVTAFMTWALLDFGDLNSRKITQIVKESGRMNEINAALVAMVEEAIEDRGAEA